MEKRYPLEKAMDEAQKIKDITGNNDTKNDIETAELIIMEEKKRILSKLREELKSSLVIDMEKSSTESYDILVGIPLEDANAVRDYLKSEKSIEVVREVQDQYGIKFCIKVR